MNNTDFHHLLLIEDEKSRRIIYLEDKVYTLGRDSTNSIVIYDRQVSRFHATLLQEKDNKNSIIYKIKDGDLKGNISTNGLIVNGKPALSQEMRHGDIIRFGGEAKVIYNIVSDPAVIALFKNGEIPDHLVRSKATLNSEQYKTTIRNTSNLEELPQEELFRLASFPELSPHPIIEIDWEGNLTYINSAASIKFKDIEYLKNNHPILSGLSPNSQNKNGSLFVREIKIGNEVFEQYVHYLSESKLIRSYVFDFTRRKQIEASTKESEELYRSVVRQSSEGICFIEAISKKIIEANQAYCQLLDYSLEEILTMTLYDIVVESELIEKELQALIPNNELVIESKQRKKDGSLIKLMLSSNRINYKGKDIFSFAIRDVILNKELQTAPPSQQQMLYDSVTNLPDRTLFKEYLSTALGNAKTHQHILAVMFLSITNFQKIPDHTNQDNNNQLLKQITQKLRFCLRSGDIIARWRINEFSILLPQVSDVKNIAKIAQRLLDSLVEPFVISEEEIKISTNIGIGIYSQDGEDAQTLLKNTDIALNRATELKNNDYQFFSVAITSNTSRLLRLENLLRQTLEKKEFLLYYQPVVNINTGELTGMEALLRWQHPELERISPEQLISIAEETDLIIPLSEWIFHTACSQNQAWQSAGLSPLPVSVNLSSRQLQQPNLVSMISQGLNDSGLEPHWLELEITEKAIMENVDLLPKTMRQLLQMGVKISIDDFGTGYCSLSYLKKYPFHAMKIDQSFVKELKDSPQDTAIISAIISLGKSFNMRVVAEGVEKQTQLELLRRLECEEIQGFLFSKPLNFEDATNFLRRTQRT